MKDVRQCGVAELLAKLRSNVSQRAVALQAVLSGGSIDARLDAIDQRLGHGGIFNQVLDHTNRRLTASLTSHLGADVHD